MDLKPCPFCGNKDIYIGRYDYCRLGILCKNCGCNIERFAPSLKGKIFEENTQIEKIKKESKAESIKAWNTRSYEK